MQTNRRTRFALLVVTIALAVSGATVSTTTGTLVDREEISVGEIEAGTDDYESTTVDGNQSNETDDGTGLESETERTSDEAIAAGMETTESSGRYSDRMV